MNTDLPSIVIIVVVVFVVVDSSVLSKKERGRSNIKNHSHNRIVIIPQVIDALFCIRQTRKIDKIVDCYTLNLELELEYTRKPRANKFVELEFQLDFHTI